MNRLNHSQWKILRSVLADSLSKIGPGSPDAMGWFSLHWNLIVGRELMAVTRVNRVSGRVLHVIVSEQKWFPALQSIRGKIIASVNQCAGVQLIDSITFEEDSVGYPARESAPDRKGLVPQEQMRPQGNKAMIKDENLQDILDRIATKFLTIPLAGMLLFVSNCSTLPTDSMSRDIDLSRSYAVKAVDKLTQKQGGGKTARDPRAYHHYLMALREVRLHQFEKAAKHFREAVKFDTANSSFHRQLAINLLRAGEIDEAYRSLDKSLRHFPDDTELNMMVADILVGRKEYGRALTHYQRVSQVDPTLSRAYLLQGTVHEQLSQPDLALEIYKKVTLVEPKNPLGHHYLARVDILYGRLREAKGHLEQALELRPTLHQSREYLAWVWEQLGNAEEAAREYRVLLKLDPLNTKIHESLAALSTSVMPVDTNAAEYRSTAEKMLGLPQAHMKIGAIYYEQGLHLKSLDEFQLARSWDQTGNMLMVLSRVYEILGRVDKAIDALEILRKMEPQSIRLMVYVARLYSLDNQPRETVRVLQNAIVTAPQNDTLYHSLALAHISIDQLDSAIERMQQAIALNGNKDSYYFELGALLERKGQYDNAVQNMKRTIELNPTHSNAHNFLGYMYATQGKSLDEALSHLQKALSIQPKNGYFYDSLGWIYYKRGESERALEELKKAMVYTPPDPVLYSHLGDVYFSLKSYSKANQAWRNALSLTLEKMEDAKGEIPDPQDLEKKIHKAQGFLNRN
jgi:tetratricopeptide (TPR) repeat protein